MQIRNIWDNKGDFAGILIDRYLVSDCISHDLLIVRLNTCGFHEMTLKILFAYLENWKQKMKLDSAFKYALKNSYSVIFKVVFGTMPNIYDGAFLWVSG